ncbi:MAG: hypothetical protein R3268_05720, partial [Acidiferrobacterales bacterium]|nr:hypothetical protein [Acidiferrobacterales bacterium]
MLNIHLIGILGLIAIAACWGLAVVLYRVGTSGSVARKLALLLLVEGVTLATAGFPEFVLGKDQYEIFVQYPVLSFFYFVLHHIGDASMLALYPAFLALALQTKLTRPFAGKKMRIAVAASSSVLFLGVMISGIFWNSGIGAMFLYVAMMLLFVFGLVASIHAWRTAERGIHRERAGIFAIAFGLRDLGWGLSYGTFAWLIWTQPEMSTMNDAAWFAKLVYALGTLLAVPLIAYGILRSHLFDIDLRVRWTIKQSTLAAIIVTLIFLISEGADRFLAAELGNWAGLFAAAIVVFFLAPLQRFAERVAGAAMPNTENTPEYTM